jgi:hypothetical protein
LKDQPWVRQVFPDGSPEFPPQVITFIYFLEINVIALKTQLWTPSVSDGRAQSSDVEAISFIHFLKQM